MSYTTINHSGYSGSTLSASNIMAMNPTHFGVIQSTKNPSLSSPPSISSPLAQYTPLQKSPLLISLPNSVQQNLLSALTALPSSIRQKLSVIDFFSHQARGLLTSASTGLYVKLSPGTLLSFNNTHDQKNLVFSPLLNTNGLLSVSDLLTAPRALSTDNLIHYSRRLIDTFLTEANSPTVGLKGVSWSNTLNTNPPQDNENLRTGDMASRHTLSTVETSSRIQQSNHQYKPENRYLGTPRQEHVLDQEEPEWHEESKYDEQPQSTREEQGLWQRIFSSFVGYVQRLLSKNK